MFKIVAKMLKTFCNIAIMFELHNFYIIILFFQHNYFNNSTKLFSDPYVATFLDISAKSSSV